LICHIALWLCLIDYLAFMPLKSIGLFNAWAADAKALKQHPQHVNDVLSYCSSRFRTALAVLVQEEDDRVDWMQDALFMELVWMIFPSLTWLTLIGRNLHWLMLEWPRPSANRSTFRFSFVPWHVTFTKWVPLPIPGHSAEISSLVLMLALIQMIQPRLSTATSWIGGPANRPRISVTFYPRRPFYSALYITRESRVK